MTAVKTMTTDRPFHWPRAYDSRRAYRARVEINAMSLAMKGSKVKQIAHFDEQLATCRAQ